MKIGDDWFTKTMVTNTLVRNEKLNSKIGNANSEFTNLFTSVLNELMENDVPTTIQPTLNSFIENMPFNNDIPNVEMDHLTLNSDEPLRFSSISAEKINQVLGGKLKGMGNAFLQAGQRYNVDPALLVAIAKHETGNGTSKAAYVKNNIAGMMGKNGLRSYTSIEESIMDMARNISKNYLGMGLSNITKIAAKYAPVGAANDPTSLNNHWVSGVSKFFGELKA
ncbi:glucosaminidase domain-containing protein [Neobacillus drentensis]|uniref:glucosaminidase domain-containing protein n=1 Tax=Neobacillus drentensis TaxID=220684 RepID=UPI002FFF3DDC